MVPLSMTLSDFWPRFQGHNIFLKSNIVKTARLKDKVTIAQEETIPIIWNATVWWPWLTSKRVERVCQHQLSFLFLQKLAMQSMDQKVTLKVAWLGSHDPLSMLLTPMMRLFIFRLGWLFGWMQVRLFGIVYTTKVNMKQMFSASVVYPWRFVVICLLEGVLVVGRLCLVY